ncbi:hypothetical protein NSE01_35410 [Novosphingobium sediminis]|uniref:Uncharacterized protein n=1 Tax=Novosphingobium sediminis TaxID=707214 RepID=A0A512APT0_9SPHN|nr:hypothetical protein NSE01_35410 [Novosphingobium sediminis]
MVEVIFDMPDVPDDAGGPFWVEQICDFGALFVIHCRVPFAEVEPTRGTSSDTASKLQVDVSETGLKFPRFTAAYSYPAGNNPAIPLVNLIFGIAPLPELRVAAASAPPEIP